MSITDRHTRYQSPLSERYASKEMCYLFSDQYKFSTWRKLWIALAEAQKELGLKTISGDQIDEMRCFQDTINFDVAREYEKKLRHEGMIAYYPCKISKHCKRVFKSSDEI